MTLHAYNLKIRLKINVEMPHNTKLNKLLCKHLKG